MPPEGIDSLDADNLKALVLSLLTRIDELLARTRVARVVVAAKKLAIAQRGELDGQASAIFAGDEPARCVRGR